MQGEVVAALYVDPQGPYPRMAGVDAWDVGRDARLYAGPHPVVAHPPCGPWGKLHKLYKGAEHDCALRAVEQVRAFGGVLEHPAHSALWAALELPRPEELPDAFGGLCIEVEQVRWGHVARKRTWLYMVGVRDIGPIPPQRAPTHWIGGYRNNALTKRRDDRSGRPIPPGIKVCSAEQRRRTPPAFAEWLVGLARKARG